MPCIIGPDTEENVLTLPILNIISQTNIFIVENIRTCRRHIKRIDPTKDINNTIFNSPHKKKILHINFNDDFDYVYKNIEIEKIFLENDRASHLNIQNYLDYYYPHIFSKCCN